MNSHKDKMKPFTLMEFIVVIMVISMVVGLVIANVGDQPAHLMIEKTIVEIEALAKEASNRAILQGKKIEVEYKIDERKFEIPSKDDSYAAQVISDDFSVCQLPEDCTLELEDGVELFSDTGMVKFIFFPDGAGSGPEFYLKLKGHSRLLFISPLTGMLNVDAEEE